MKNVILMKVCSKCGIEIVSHIVNPNDYSLIEAKEKIDVVEDQLGKSFSDDSCKHKFSKIQLLKVS